MHAALHACDWNAADSADYKLPGVPDCGGLREIWDFRVWDFDGVGECVREIAQTGSEN